MTTNRERVADDVRAAEQDDVNGVNAFRERVVAAIPDSYKPWLHVLATTSVGAAAVAFGAWRLTNVGAAELLTVPIMFVVSNGVEWRAHRNILHRPLWPLKDLYQRHTPEHHRVFRHHDMAVRSWKELKLVLIPASGVAAIIAAAVPAAALAGAVFGSNVGMLVFITSGAYVATYELSHLVYHLPEESFFGRLPFVKVFREHHARHHEPRLMQKWNFNVTVPLWDALMGTIASDELLQKVQARFAKASAA